MSQEGQLPPFKSLGNRLRTIRQKLHESVAEVSGAVEIDEPMLARIEQGQERPTEDILMLLISHFGMHEDEAAGLWHLAGYEPPRDREDDDSDSSEPINANKATILVMAVDPRIIYSDGVQVHASQAGIVLNFSQGAVPHLLTTARIGMSRDQATRVLGALQQALEQSEPRQLSDGQAGGNDGDVQQNAQQPSQRQQPNQQQSE